MQILSISQGVIVGNPIIAERLSCISLVWLHQISLAVLMQESAIGFPNMALWEMESICIVYWLPSLLFFLNFISRSTTVYVIPDPIFPFY